MQKLGVITPAAGLPDDEVKRNAEKNNKKIEAASKKLYEAIKSNKTQKPGLLGVIAFYFQKRAFARGEHDSTDYLYWKGQGWLEKDVKYFYDVNINPVKKAIALVVAKIMFCFIPKPPKLKKSN